MTIPSPSSALPLLLSSILVGCGAFSEPEIVVPPDEVFVEVLSGDRQADSALAVLAPIVVRTATNPGTPVPVPNRIFRSQLPLEGCGTLAPESRIGNEFGVAEFTWTLGEMAGECVARILAVDPGGIPYAFEEVKATIRPGRPTFAWLEPGGAVSALDTLRLGADTLLVADQHGNTLTWGLQVLSGPVVVAANQPSPGSFLVVATNLGSGEVTLGTTWGVLDTLRLDVCPSGARRLVRLHRRAEPGAPVPPCPS